LWPDNKTSWAKKSQANNKSKIQNHQKKRETRGQKNTYEEAMISPYAILLNRKEIWRVKRKRKS
jgi:hypothetical protein